MPKHTIQNLESVIRSGDKFYARYEWKDEVVINYTLPAYTGGVAANGRLYVSKSHKIVVPDKQVRRQDARLPISKEEASELYDAALATNSIRSFERLGDKEWIARII